jgi:SH3-like domain-containing protein
VPLPISRGTELKVVQVSAFGTLNMREKPTNESRVVEFIPPNGEGIISLGETYEQWVFVQYDRAKGWVERQFVMPVLSDGGRM